MEHNIKYNINILKKLLMGYELNTNEEKILPIIKQELEDLKNFVKEYKDNDLIFEAIYRTINNLLAKMQQCS